MSTSFVKKINTAPQLYKKQKGVKPYSNQQYSISTGNPTLDQYIGGGLPIGSLVVLLEDQFSHYYDHFLKTFLGEGIVNEQKLLIIDPDLLREKEHWLKFLPAVYKIKDQQSSQGQEKTQDQKQAEELKVNEQQQLKVAWRYNNLLSEDAKNDNEIQYKFDNSREMGKAFSNSMSHQLQKDELTIHFKFSNETTNYIDLWEQIAEQIQNNLDTESDDRIFRILLPNLNLFLKSDMEDQHLKKRNEQDLIRFLRNLKTMLRSTNAVCLLSFDEDLLSKHMVNNVIFLADSVFKITSFKDHQEMQIGEYDGTIKLVNQPRIHGLICTLSDFDIYALKLKGKSGIIVEKIHLEPEDDRAGQDENLQQKGTQKKKQKQQIGSTASVQCNPTKAHQLDF